MRPLNSIRARLRREDGMVLPMAALILAVIGILALVVAESAINGSHEADRQIYSRQALAIADAAVQIADSRVSAAANVPNAPLGPTQCYVGGGASDSRNVVVGAGNACPASATENFGDAANGTYYYTVLPLKDATVPCTGWWVNGAPGQTVVQRCITGVGTYHGVTRRVQERVVDAPTGATFPYSGLFSLGAMSFTNQTTITGDVAADGNITMNNATVTNGTITSVPPATVSNPPQLTCGTGCTKTTSATPLPAPTMDGSKFAAAAASNADAAIAWPSGAYTPGNNELTDSHDLCAAPASSCSSANPLVIPSGVYYFCEIDLTGNVYLKIPAGAHVVIYVDSPYRSGSSCPANSGDVIINNNLVVQNDAGPSNLEFDVWGNPSASANQQPQFILTNQGTSGALAADVFAPYSQVTLNNTFNMTGLIVGGTIKGTGKTTFTASAGGSSLGNPSDTYYPIAWHQCPASWSGTNIGAGCAS